jgi:hypothetical protein
MSPSRLLKETRRRRRRRRKRKCAHANWMYVQA